MMGPGMMQGGMGPGMMQGGMGPGMMQGGMGPGMMQGGMGALFGSRVTPMMNLSVEDVRGYLTVQLDRLNNKRLKSETLRPTTGPSPPTSSPSTTRLYSGLRWTGIWVPSSIRIDPGPVCAATQRNTPTVRVPIVAGLALALRSTTSKATSKTRHV